MKNKSAIMLSMIVEPNADGHLVSVSGIKGAFAEGDTIEEAMFNCVDVVKMIFVYRLERHEHIGFNQVEFTPKTRMTVTVPVGL